MFTKLEQRSWIKIEVARSRSMQECFQELRGALWRCSVALSHSGMMDYSVPRRQGCRSIQPRYRTTSCGEKHSSTTFFPVGCWSPMNCAWVSSGSRSMLQNCAPHSARYSGLPQIWSALDTIWNFRGSTMAPLCNRTGLVGPLAKGRWRLSSTNRCYGRNSRDYSI